MKGSNMGLSPVRRGFVCHVNPKLNAELLFLDLLDLLFKKTVAKWAWLGLGKRGKKLLG